MIRNRRRKRVYHNEAGTRARWLRSPAGTRAIVDSAPFPTLAIGPSGTVRFASGPCQQVLGYAASALIGLDLFELVDPVEREQVRDSIRAGSGSTEARV